MARSHPLPPTVEHVRVLRAWQGHCGPDVPWFTHAKHHSNRLYTLRQRRQKHSRKPYRKSCVMASCLRQSRTPIDARTTTSNCRPLAIESDPGSVPTLAAGPFGAPGTLCLDQGIDRGCIYDGGVVSQLWLWRIEFSTSLMKETEEREGSREVDLLYHPQTRGRGVPQLAQKKGEVRRATRSVDYRRDDPDDEWSQVKITPRLRVWRCAVGPQI
jgi:hypothetical protein